MEKTAKLIEELLNFGLYHKMIEKLDLPLVRNMLMDLLDVQEPASMEESYTVPEYPVDILNRILDEAVKRSIIEESLSQREILDARIMACFMPRQSELYNMYKNIKEWDGIEKASEFYYNLSKKSNYIRTDRIAKNKYWKCNTNSGDLEITINLSKPEKDPKDIAKAGKSISTNYPKCLLCVENVGYKGHVNHPARSNHRVIPLTLNGEDWYYQYSPYVYYNEHAIIFKAAHEPMKICKESFIRLTDFVESMPHYFIGSNADLPIVGGSILSHDHFQGGNHRFPMVDAPVVTEFSHSDFIDINISIVKWPMSVIRVESKSKESLVEFATMVLNRWREYSDKESNILAYSNIDGSEVPHNTITPIARRNDSNLFELDLVLRNNRCDEEHPDGIYHPHKHLHHIKKENIGLIEVMGLAILPPRIEYDINTLTKVLTGELDMGYVKENMLNHYDWFSSLTDGLTLPISSEMALELLQQGVADRFSEVLECAGVYKQTPEGIEAFKKFILSTGATLK